MADVGRKPPVPLPPKRNAVRLSWRVNTLLLACLALTIIYYVFRPSYYQWLFDSADRVNVVVYCDMSVFEGNPIDAMAGYDQVALAPISQVFGLFQNRPPKRVTTCYWVDVDVDDYDDSAVWLRDVPLGPMSQIRLSLGGRSFYVYVTDRDVADGRITVRARGR